MKKFITIICAACFLLIWGCSENTIDVVYTGTLTGKVTEKATGDPLENVKITTKPGFTTVYTDSLGEFMIKNIPVEDYAVQAELTGYTTSFQAVSIIEDNTSSIAIALALSNTNNQPPSIPILISPEDGAVDLPLEVTFEWKSSDPEKDELSYTLDLRNGSTNDIQVFEVASDTIFTVGDLQLATKYFWQVTVTDNNNDPVSSIISEFKTLTFPDNPFTFVKEKNGNLVIYSGELDPGSQENTVPDYNVLQLTSENQNSFRPKKSNILKKIAFLSNSGGNTHIFTMNTDGTDLRKITAQKPVAGFRTEELEFTWAQNDSKIYYPHFDKLYSINSDGSGIRLEYTTLDGAFISEAAVPEFDGDLVLLKTNNLNGYDVRVYTARLSNRTEETIILENVSGAVSGIDISANADKVLFTHDISGSQNSSYRIFESRIFIQTVGSANPPIQLETTIVPGQNDLDVKFSPSEGGVIFTRVKNNFGAIPDIYIRNFDQNEEDRLLFTNSFMPNWE